MSKAPQRWRLKCATRLPTYHYSRFVEIPMSVALLLALSLLAFYANELRLIGLEAEA
jgi:hypothetical protein